MSPCEHLHKLEPKMTLTDAEDRGYWSAIHQLSIYARKHGIDAEWIMTAHQEAARARRLETKNER